MANIQFGTSDKYLFFKKANDDCVLVRASKLIMARKKSGSTIALHFEGSSYQQFELNEAKYDEAPTDTDAHMQFLGNVRITLNCATGKGDEACRDIVNAINVAFSGDDPVWKRSSDASGFIVGADAIAGTYISDSITGVDSIVVDGRSKKDQVGDDTTA